MYIFQLKNSSLSILEVSLKAPEGIKISQSIGSVMHGALMEFITAETKEWLHEYSRRPFSQYVFYDRQENLVKWRIGSLCNEARERILNPLSQLQSELYLKQKGFSLQVSNISWVEETNYNDIMDRFLGEDIQYRKIKWEFISPTAFKNEGTYTFMPELGLIYNNLLRRWNTFSDAEKIDYPELVESLVSHSQLVQYRLSSLKFGLEKTQVPAFKGEIVVHVKSSPMIKRIIALLVTYSNFSGVGIKTALGMGGVKGSIIL